VLLQAAATFGAIAAAGGVAPAARQTVRAQEEAADTLIGDWYEAEQRVLAAADTGDAVTVQADFPFFAVGVHWAGEVGTWPTIELSFSPDGATFTEPVYLNAQEVDAGRPDRDGRIFTDLAFIGGGASFVRYRVLDLDDNPTSAAGLGLTYIDATAGPETPTETGFAAEALPPLQQPTIISRAGWGANESYRFDAFGESWTREYREVRHAIIHHTVTTNSPSQNGAAEVRAVYAYHALTRGWGDIGYNYLTDRFGNIYEGRFGGENVVGGHAYQYAFGSSGIGNLGTFNTVDVTAAQRSAIVAITAWVARALDPLGFEDFLEAPNLPTICGHRDVTQDTCPGNALYDDLPGIRQAVKDILDATDGPPVGEPPPPPPAEFTTGDNVRTTEALNLREEPSFSSGIIATMPQGTLCAVIGLARPLNDGYVWYPLRTAYGDGWAAGNYLEFAPVGNVPAPTLQVGQFATVTQNGVALRARPGTPQTQIATLASGNLVEITVDSVAATGHRWWGVYRSGSGGGWVSQQFLQATAPPPSPEFEVGDPIFVDTDALYLRSGPGTSYSVLASMPTGTKGTVVGGPVVANGYTWWNIQTGFGIGWAAGEFLSLDPNPGPDPDPTFEIGDTVEVIDDEGVNLRATPSTSAGIIAQLPTGTLGEVIGGPQAGSGFTWYQIVTALGTGWAIEESLAETDPPPPPPGSFEPGDTVEIVTSTTINMRNSPSRDAPTIDKVANGELAEILAGPQVVGSDVWYQIQSATNSGWVLGKFLIAADEPPPPVDEIEVGDTVEIVTSTSINVRDQPSRSATTIGKAFNGETATILAGPQAVAGDIWHRIQTPNVAGWVLSKFLVEVEGPPPPGGIAVGDTVVVDTDALNLRSSPSLGGSVLAVMPNGTTLTVLGGPQTASGYTWWQVQNATYGPGWSAADYLREV
jgi:uncharacterized protein YgiM (DUF1202 family)